MPQGCDFTAVGGAQGKRDSVLLWTQRLCALFPNRRQAVQLLIREPGRPGFQSWLLPGLGCGIAVFARMCFDNPTFVSPQKSSAQKAQQQLEIKAAVLRGRGARCRGVGTWAAAEVGTPGRGLEAGCTTRRAESTRESFTSKPCGTALGRQRCQGPGASGSKGAFLERFLLP